MATPYLLPATHVYYDRAVNGTFKLVRHIRKIGYNIVH